MGREITYFCDACHKTFGDNPHLNLKNGNLNLSHKKGADWKRIPIKIPCSEFHFCNADCLRDWIGIFIDTATDAYNAGKGEKNETV